MRTIIRVIVPCSDVIMKSLFSKFNKELQKESDSSIAYV